MAKRSAPPSAAEPSTKKPKSASGSKPTSKSKSKAKPTTEDVTSSTLDTVKQAATDLISTVSEAVGVAGDLLYDDGNTPAPVSQVVKENVDVPALKKKGKAAKEKATEAASSVQDKVVETAKPLKGKAAKAAKDAQEAVEAAVEEKTGVDVKAVKGKAGKAAKAAKGKVDAAVEAVEPEVEKVVEAAKDPKNRKRAEDFLTQAEETVMKVVGDVATKIGEVATGIVDQFGEASGLAGDIEDQTQKGKKKAKAIVAEGKKEVTKKGKQAVEGVKEQATKKGKQAKEAVEEKAAPIVEEGKKQAAKKGKQAKEAVEDVKEKAGKKGKQAQEVVVEVEEKAAKKGKQAQKAAEEVVETGKRKAKDVVEAVEPTSKKVKAAAEPTAKKVKAAAEPVVEQGKKVAKETTKSAKGTAAKATKAVVDTAAEVVGEDEDVEMGGFSSSDGEADSSDDESDAEDLAVAEAGRKIDMSTLPSVAKDDKSVQARLKKASKKKDEPKGTLFVGRIPHGFYEEQMKEYFSQFGDISRVRLARNSKTGASKHYAYVEISSTSVAEIVAETMDNYLLMGHLLRVNVIPPEQVHPQLWVGANKKFRKVPRARVEQQKHDKPRTDEQKTRANEKVIKKQNARKQKIKDAGIDYHFEGHA